MLWVNRTAFFQKIEIFRSI